MHMSQIYIVLFVVHSYVLGEEKIDFALFLLWNCYVLSL
jgi:hypothetical protein